MQKSSRSVKEMELAQQAVFNGGRDEDCNRRIAARIEKNRQIASIEGCSRRDENPAVGAHKQCDREVFLLSFHDM
ncbi:hypothetical protein WN943_000754 [Citrus x changshan-huyou]